MMTFQDFKTMVDAPAPNWFYRWIIYLIGMVSVGAFMVIAFMFRAYLNNKELADNAMRADIKEAMKENSALSARVGVVETKIDNNDKRILNLETYFINKQTARK